MHTTDLLTHALGFAMAMGCVFSLALLGFCVTVKLLTQLARWAAAKAKNLTSF